MGNVTVSTTPVQLDDGTANVVNVGNKGTVAVTLSGGGVPASGRRIEPGSSADIRPRGVALTAVTSSGSTTLAVDTTGQTPGTAVGTQEVQPLTGSDAWLKLHAGGNLDALLVGAITRDSNGAATDASVVWPDGTTGTYAATTVSTAFPGAVDAFTVTYVGATTKTVTQPAVTRDATTGAVTTRPAMTVS